MIGSTGFVALQGLAFHPSRGELFATDANRLVKIDVVSGAGTLVGSTRISVAGLEWR